MADIKRRAPHYVSDWTDAFLPANRGRCLSSVAFLFFACLAPAIAFGALFAEYTNDQLGATEMILSSAISGVAYAFLSGQPLCILGATGTCPSARSRVPQNERRFSSQPLFLFSTHRSTSHTNPSMQDPSSRTPWCSTTCAKSSESSFSPRGCGKACGPRCSPACYLASTRPRS